MRGFVGVTDFGWYQHLRVRPHLDEVNFWRPGGVGFKALPEGGLFFFKLKAPHDAIAGFGQFARFERMPVWLAWEVFGEANGVSSERALVSRLGRLARSSGRDLRRETAIGCILVAFPVFFDPDDWVVPPDDWKPNVVSGAGYDLNSGGFAPLARVHGGKEWCAAGGCWRRIERAPFTHVLFQTTVRHSRYLL